MLPPPHSWHRFLLFQNVSLCPFAVSHSLAPIIDFLWLETVLLVLGLVWSFPLVIHFRKSSILLLKAVIKKKTVDYDITLWSSNGVFIYSLLDGHLSCFQFGTLTNKTNSIFENFLEVYIYIHFSLGKYLEVELPNHVINVYIYFKNLFIFIYLSVLGLSHGMWDLWSSLWHAGSFSCHMWTLLIVAYEI